MISRAFLPLSLLSLVMASCATTTGGGGTSGPGPDSGGPAYIVVDAFNKKIHNARNPDARRQVASLTKVATGLVVLDWARATQTNLNSLATVPPSAAQLGAYNATGLMPGDQIALRDALSAALKASDNISAHTLAHFVGSDLLRRQGRSGDPVAHFVRQMNILAESLSMKNTRFENPAGLDNFQAIPYSTARDIGLLALHASNRPDIVFYTSQGTRNITFFRAGQPITIPIANTNQLLGVDRINGLKTGETARAGGCLILTADRQSTQFQDAAGATQLYHHRMIVVVLGAPDRFGLGRGLLNDGWARYDRWIAAGRPVTERSELLLQE
jgi:serine-type D-Ala-D-Ala carboxypeptidase (penicillin-binding protein 5/6)